MSDAYGQQNQPATTPGWPPAAGPGAPSAPEYPATPGYPANPGQPGPGEGFSAAPAPYAGYPQTGAPVGYAQPGEVAAYPQPGQYPAYPQPGQYPAYPQPGAYAPGAQPFLGEKPKNGLATGALVAGIAVVVILAWFGFAIASALAIFLSVRAIKRANEIKRSGYPQAVGMTRALIGLAFSAIGLIFYVLSFTA
ncbi:hypothetical protein [Cellulomonas alba]|uniref:DUF4190 domain-containing protein n=1 Tax=Cellulomonas alba TaxID=3053467 RepID=A0ABT7SI67_9CELL|nr:hypothetical protein [Cellulomonas alba]MDM7855739.1 hypothetical protein [Cellulomonas alba]